MRCSSQFSSDVIATGFWVLLFVVGWIVYGTAYQHEVDVANQYLDKTCETTNFQALLLGGAMIGQGTVTAEECQWRNLFLFQCAGDDTNCMNLQIQFFNGSWPCHFLNCGTFPRRDKPNPLGSFAAIVSFMLIIAGGVLAPIWAYGTWQHYRSSRVSVPDQ